MSEEIPLDLTDDEIHTIVNSIAKDLSDESKSYLKYTETPQEMFEGLGRAMFNEYIINAIKVAMENSLDK